MAETYTEYMAQVWDDGKWRCVTDISVMRNKEKIMKAIEKKKAFFELPGTKQIYKEYGWKIPKKWRIVSRNVTTTDWEQV